MLDPIALARKPNKIAFLQAQETFIFCVRSHQIEREQEMEAMVWKERVMSQKHVAQSNGWWIICMFYNGSHVTVLISGHFINNPERSLPKWPHPLISKSTLLSVWPTGWYCSHLDWLSHSQGPCRDQCITFRFIFWFQFFDLVISFIWVELTHISCTFTSEIFHTIFVFVFVFTITQSNPCTTVWKNSVLSILMKRRVYKKARVTYSGLCTHTHWLGFYLGLFTHNRKHMT